MPPRSSVSARPAAAMRLVTAVALAFLAAPPAVRADSCLELGGELGFITVKDKNWFLPPATKGGAVLMLPLQPGGFDEQHSELINRATTGIPGERKAGEQFGGAIACGGEESSDEIVGKILIVAQKDLLIGEPPSTTWNSIGGLTPQAVGVGKHRAFVSTSDGGLRVLGPRNGTLAVVDSFALPTPQSAPAPTAVTPKPPGVVLAIGKRNADAFEDLLVGVPTQTVSGKQNAGAVYEFLGTATGIRHTPNRIYRRGSSRVPGTPIANEFFGAQLSLVDFDHKGIDNLIIGVPDAYGKTGAFYAEKSDGTFFAQTLALGALPGTYFGWSIGRANLNGDAYPDFVIGAPGFKSGSVENAGAIYLYAGGPTTPTYLRAITVAQPLGQTTPLGFGASIAAADIAGHGTDQLFVGAPCFDLPGKKDAGALVPVDLAGLYAPIHLDRGAIAGEAAANDHLGSGNGSSLLGGARTTALCAGN